MSIRLCALALLILGLAARLPAQDLVDRDPRALANALRGLAAVEDRDDAVTLQGPAGETLRAVGTRTGLSVGVPGGPRPAEVVFQDGRERLVAIPVELLELPDPADLATSALALLETAPPGTGALRELRHDPVLGFHATLEDDTIVTQRHGRLRPAPSPDRPVSLDALTESVGRAKAAVDAHAELTPLAKAALRHFAGQLLLAGESDEEEHVTPDLARRLAREGFMERALGREVTDIAASVTRATTPVATRIYTGEDGDGAFRVEFLQDAFGERGLRLVRGEAVRERRFRMPRPSFLPIAPPLEVALRLDAEGGIAGASVWNRGRRLADWKGSGGLEADRRLWDLVFPFAESARVTKLASSFMPPHLVLVDENGATTLLVTGSGHVAPPGHDGDGFIARAAKVLPDAGHLDLVGEYFFDYVDDSPDPTRPWLVGFKGAIGEIHQTVEQTIGTATGGLCRGDCDDLAELYQALTRAQGKLSHIMAVPRHNALAWAEKDEETDRWTVFVLQTGTPLEFRARKIERALGYAYQQFGMFENFDPDQCPIAVRFSGENQRSTWVLGWRIFVDAKYAETMIDVQRDWHFHTYSRGFDKMRALIASGDEDVANYRELAGLSERTGQYDEAVLWLERARTRSGDDRLTLASRLAANLLLAGREKEARDVVAKAAARIDSLPERSAGTRVQLAMEIAQIALSTEDVEPFLPVLEKHLTPTVGAQIEVLAMALADGRLDAEAWKRDPGLGEIRDLARTYVAIATHVVEVANTGGLAKNPLVRRMARQVETWTNELAFRDPETESAGEMPRYAAVGILARAELGREAFDALLEKAPVAKGDRPDADRTASLAQLGLDLPWIRSNPLYWSSLALDLARREVETLDRPALARCHRGLEAALASGAWSEEDLSHVDELLRRSRFAIALLEGDLAAVRAHLAHVAEQGDKDLRDDAVRIAGSVARLVDDATWTGLLTAWDELVGAKPGYYALAWEAVAFEAPRRGLEAGELAAKRFADDPAFVEELGLLRGIVEKLTAPEPAGAGR
ncbi:MAG: hypothetical protein R3F20_15250 [Planctomycetota bacterium]